MARPRLEPSPEQLDALRGQIQNWRQSRKVPGSVALRREWVEAIAQATNCLNPLDAFLHVKRQAR